jgi:MFS family permease
MPVKPAFAAIASAAVRSYLRSLNPQLPRDVWILQAGGLANMFGNGVLGPFLIIYLHNVRGISLGVAGLVVASNSAAGLVSAFVGGALSDRIGPRAVLSGALVVMAIAFGLFPLIRDPWHAFALNMLAGAGSGSFWPSQSTLLSSLTPRERRHAAFAQQRMTMNLGIALGGLVAGAIARTDHPKTFTVLFLINAATFLVFVAVLRLVPAPRHVAPHHEPGHYVSVLRNRVFIAYIVLNVVFIGAGIAVMAELLPPFAKNTAHVSEPAIGVIWFVFSGVVALAQLPVVKLVEGRRRLHGLALMGIVWAGAFLAVLMGGAWLTGAWAALVFGGAVAGFALGACLHGAIYAPLVVDLAEPRLLGRYMAFSSFSWQLGWLVGPAAGGFVLQHEPLALWPAVAGICVLASTYALALEQAIPPEVHLTPARSARPRSGPMEGVRGNREVPPTSFAEPGMDSVAGVPGTISNVAPATDDPLSTDAEPAPHPADAASRLRRGGRRAPGTTRR